jgi:hypothetical protein
MELLLCVIGMVMVVEGLPYFGFPHRMKEMMALIQRQDDRTLRIMGALMMAAGLAIVYIARSGPASQ